MRKLQIINIIPSINSAGKVMVPDSEGYYNDINLGALNVENTSGQFYKVTDRVLDLFKNPKIFLVKKLLAKELYGESNHPKMPPEIERIIHTDKGKRTWMIRQMEFDRDRISHHIRSVGIREVNVIDRLTGLRKVLITGSIKPHGEKSKELEESFANPNISTAFSIRAACIETIENGRLTKELISIFTWDSVLSPGILGSNDQHSLVTEFDMSDLGQLMEDISKSGTLTQEEGVELCSIVKEMSDSITTSPTLLNDW